MGVLSDNLPRCEHGNRSCLICSDPYAQEEYEAYIWTDAGKTIKCGRYFTVEGARKQTNAEALQHTPCTVYVKKIRLTGEVDQQIARYEKNDGLLMLIGHTLNGREVYVDTDGKSVFEDGTPCVAMIDHNIAAGPAKYKAAPDVAKKFVEHLMKTPEQIKQEAEDILEAMKLPETE